jgi:hypothetical protein
MKTLFRLLIVLWLLLLTLAQRNALDAQIYTTLTLRGVVTDVNTLQLNELQKKRGLPLQ